jgi:ubiquinol-cytochrome c reductase cytochrome b subunit
VLIVALLAVVMMVVPGIAFDPKLWGVVLMGLSVMTFFALPWLDRSPVKSMRYRPTWHRVLLMAFAVVFIVLGFLGTLPPDPIRTTFAQIGTILYFAFFYLMPWWSRAGSFKPVPDRVSFAAH